LAIEPTGEFFLAFRVAYRASFPFEIQFEVNSMKIVTMIARYLLGLMFLVLGANVLHPFIPMGPMPAGLAGQFMVALFAAHYFYVVGTIMLVSAILFLVNRFVGLGLTLLGPVLFNILLFHLTMNLSGIWPGAFATLLWLLVAWEHRIVFEKLFAPRLEE
jgi:putative oxidoreductase